MGRGSHIQVSKVVAFYSKVLQTVFMANEQVLTQMCKVTFELLAQVFYDSAKVIIFRGQIGPFVEAIRRHERNGVTIGMLGRRVVDKRGAYI